MTTKTPKKILFIHVVKTGGSYVMHHLGNYLAGRSYQICDIESQHDRREFVSETLIRTAKDPSLNDKKILLHCHADFVPEEIFRVFKENGWFTFSFVRHPGDLLCSYYYYAFINPRFNIHGDLNFFIYSTVSTSKEYAQYTKLDHFGIPAYWRDLDFIQEFNELNFSNFLRQYFGHSYVPGSALNKGLNLGYRHYCDSGQISEETQALLEKHEQCEWYFEVKKREAVTKAT